jgi:RimJ/RimL family protein N-acetyltransferase
VVARTPTAAARTGPDDVGRRPTIDAVLVGACGVFPQEGALELAYIISHLHRGRRYASEAAGLVIEALDNADIQVPVYATIRPDNVASRRVAEGLGLRCTEESTDDRGALLVYRR